jgi:hypothetical protein
MFISVVDFEEVGISESKNELCSASSSGYRSSKKKKFVFEGSKSCRLRECAAKRSDEMDGLPVKAW